MPNLWILNKLPYKTSNLKYDFSESEVNFHCKLSESFQVLLILYHKITEIENYARSYQRFMMEITKCTYRSFTRLCLVNGGRVCTHKRILSHKKGFKYTEKKKKATFEYASSISLACLTDGWVMFSSMNYIISSDIVWLGETKSSFILRLYFFIVYLIICILSFDRIWTKGADKCWKFLHVN